MTPPGRRRAGFPRRPDQRNTACSTIGRNAPFRNAPLRSERDGLERALGRAWGGTFAGAFPSPGSPCCSAATPRPSAARSGAQSSASIGRASEAPGSRAADAQDAQTLAQAAAQGGKVPCLYRYEATRVGGAPSASRRGGDAAGGVGGVPPVERFPQP